MGEIVSLKLHRKRKARAGKEAEAEQNRITHGLTRAERELAEARNEKAKKDLDAKKREE
jgi:hypothetical protein